MDIKQWLGMDIKSGNDNRDEQHIVITYNDKTKKVHVDILNDGGKLDLCEAMPYIMDELYELVVQYQKSKMMR